MNLESHIAIARSLTVLMHPLVEVVIHDLASNTIAFLAGSLSKRKVGDPSLLDLEAPGWEEEIHESVYRKVGFDGRLVKSVSVPIYENGKATALMCINYDLTAFQAMKTFADGILQVSDKLQADFLFKNDWQERIHTFLAKTLNAKGLRLDSLSLREKKELVHLLYKEGAFHEKNAAEYIAQILDLGRATIFNYLRQWRSQ